MTAMAAQEPRKRVGESQENIMTRKKTLTTRGFTLLEVLIAVLIVGIIATVALPMLGSYTDKAREAREEANDVVKAQAIDRYNMDHQAPLGTVYDPSDSSLQTYGLETMQGPTAQFLFPTDVNGNVLGDPMTVSPGPFSYGPYLAELPPEPASLLAGNVTGARSPELEPLLKNPIILQHRTEVGRRYVKGRVAALAQGTPFPFANRGKGVVVTVEGPEGEVEIVGGGIEMAMAVMRGVITCLEESGKKIPPGLRKVGELIKELKETRKEVDLFKQLGNTRSVFVLDEHGMSPFITMAIAHTAWVTTLEHLGQGRKAEEALAEDVVRNDIWQGLRHLEAQKLLFAEVGAPLNVRANIDYQLKARKDKLQLTYHRTAEELNVLVTAWGRNHTDVMTTLDNLAGEIAKVAGPMRKVMADPRNAVYDPDYDALGQPYGVRLGGLQISEENYYRTLDAYRQSGRIGDLTRMSQELQGKIVHDEDLLRGAYARREGIEVLYVDHHLKQREVLASNALQGAFMHFPVLVGSEEFFANGRVPSFKPRKGHNDGFGFLNFHVWWLDWLRK